jgi:hypothetical protein
VFPPNGNAKRRAVLEEKLAEAVVHVATVTVTVNVEGAEVLAGGKSLGRAPLPRAVYLEAGETALEAKHEGYADAKASKTLVAGGAETVALELKKTGSDKPPPPPPGPSYTGLATGLSIAGGVGIAIGIAGIVTASGASSDIDGIGARIGPSTSACNAPTAGAAADCADLDSAASSKSTGTGLAIGGFVGGGVLAVGAITLWALSGSSEDASDKSALRVLPQLSPTQSGAVLMGSF